LHIPLLHSWQAAISSLGPGSLSTVIAALLSQYLILPSPTIITRGVGESRVRLLSYEPDIERVCAAAMRSCYSPHPGYELFTYTGTGRVLEGERVFDQERVAGLLKRALELGHYDILEHNSITWLADAEEAEILTLLNSSKFFETSKIDEKRWLITTNLRVLVEIARGNNHTDLTKELVSTLDTAAPSIASVLATPPVKQ